MTKIEQMIKLAKLYTAIKKENDIAAVYENSVQLMEEEYRSLWPNYREHNVSVCGSHIRVSNMIDDVEFFALFEIKSHDLVKLIWLNDTWKIHTDTILLRNLITKTNYAGGRKSVPLIELILNTIEWRRKAVVRESPRSKNKRYLEPYTLKRTVIPDGFVLVIDTNETLPFFSRPPAGLMVVRESLANGDYSIRGYERQVSIERKKDDIWAYCISHEETKEKMERFREFEFAALVIEHKESELYQFQEYCTIHPERVRGALISFNVRYGVHIYCGDRANCERWILDRLVKFWNIKHEIK
jgi:hypothetical protein